jgi:restriction endonuclease Mrr
MAACSKSPTRSGTSSSAPRPAPATSLTNCANQKNIPGKSKKKKIKAINESLTTDLLKQISQLSKIVSSKVLDDSGQKILDSCYKNQAITINQNYPK